MKKALLVGINDYPGVYNDLMGCVNDVRNMQNLLVSMFGFASQDITRSSPIARPPQRIS
jgi:hypothetical protein